MILLGEAYAFGVVWSFVFKALSMVVLRFKDREPREYKVPLNFRIGRRRDPDRPDASSSWSCSFTAVLNFLTKEVATVGGLVFTAAFFITVHRLRALPRAEAQGRRKHEHMEQFNQATTEEVTAGEPRPDQAVPQAGGDPLDAEPVHAGKGAGRDRPGDDRHGGDDGQGAAAGGGDRRRNGPTWTPTTSS